MSNTADKQPVNSQISAANPQTPVINPVIVGKKDINLPIADVPESQKIEGRNFKSIRNMEFIIKRILNSDNSEKELTFEISELAKLIIELKNAISELTKNNYSEIMELSELNSEIKKINSEINEINEITDEINEINSPSLESKTVSYPVYTPGADKIQKAKYTIDEQGKPKVILCKPNNKPLQACPWCKAMPYIDCGIGVDDSVDEDHVISCENPECPVQPFITGEMIDDLIERWNRKI